MNYSIVIPARMNSSRLAQKMMCDLAGMPLIERTWRQAQLSQAQQIIIATDDQRIADHMSALDADVIMTSADHSSGTDRLSEVSLKRQFSANDIIVNWQGDEPFLPINFIQTLVDCLITHPRAAMSTLAIPITDTASLRDDNIVKVVCNQEQYALYFSRAPIPYPRDFNWQSATLPTDFPVFKHLGLYAYRAAFLNAYPQLSPSPLEKLEKLEQLRALHNGYQIIVDYVEGTPPTGIDTAADLASAIKWLKTQH